MKQELNQLYRYYDKDGNLLYVGISKNALYRAIQHSNLSHWYPAAVTIKIENFETQDELIVAEKLAIINENPIHNKKIPSNSEKQRLFIANPENCEKTMKLSSGFMTVRELAEYLGVSESWVHNHSKKRGCNMIPSINKGKNKRFDCAAVAQWIDMLSGTPWTN